MANRFWVKTAGGTWTSADTTNWSTTTGGVSGASVPGSADTAIFDNNSGSNTITTNYNASLAGLTLDTTNLFAGTLTLGGTLTTSAATSLFSGTFNSAGFAMTCLSITGSSANTRSINITNSTINLTSTAAATLWNMATVTGLTFTATGSTINYTGVTANARTFNGGTGSVNTYGTIKISAGTGGITFNNLVCTDLDFTGFTGNLNAGLVANISGSMTLGTGMTTSDSANAYTFSATSGTKTITSNGVQFNHPIIFDGVGGTWQLADAIALGVRAITVTNGSFTSNAKAMNMAGFNSTNANTRSITLDNSAINLTGTGTISNMSNTSGLTLSTTGTVWTVSDTSSTGKTINWGTGTWGSLTAPGGNSGTLTITGPNSATRTFNALTLNPQQIITFGTSTNNVNAATSITGTGRVNGYQRLEGVSGHFISAPDSAALSIVSDIDVQWRGSLDNWTPAVVTELIAKWTSTSNQRSYHLNVAISGKLSFTISPDGTSTAQQFATSTLAPTVSNGASIWLRCTYVQSTGNVQFFSAPDAASVPSSWTQLGTTVTTIPAATAIFDSNAVLEIGSFFAGTSQFLIGNVYRARVLNGVAGTVAFDADFTTKTVGVDSFSESSVNAATVSITGAQAQVGDGRILINSASAGTASTLSSVNAVSLDYTTVQDNTASGNTPFYAGANGRLVSNTTNWLLVPSTLSGGTMLLMGVG